MTKRKRVEAWVEVLPSGGFIMVFSKKPKDPDFEMAHLVEHDPAANALVKEVLAHYKDHGSRVHSNTCRVCWLASRYEKKHGEKP